MLANCKLQHQPPRDGVGLKPEMVTPILSLVIFIELNRILQNTPQFYKSIPRKLFSAYPPTPIPMLWVSPDSPQHESHRLPRSGSGARSISGRRKLKDVYKREIAIVQRFISRLAGLESREQAKVLTHSTLPSTSLHHGRL